MNLVYAIGIVAVTLVAIGVAGALAIQGLPVPDLFVNIAMAGLGTLFGVAGAKKLGGS